MLRWISSRRRSARAGLIAICLAPVSGLALAQPREVRPQAVNFVQPVQPLQTPEPEFLRFVESLWPEARARGVSRATFDEAFAGVAPDPKIIALSQKQSEFLRPIWDYMATAAAPSRIAKGQQISDEWAGVLEAVERTYAVPKGIVLGIWGMETNFGKFTGSNDVVRALATLAFVRYRGDFFRDELLIALQILEQKHVARANRLGSWAGAMGQTQFMPSSYVKYAVDGDRDGTRDIWSSMPDALASTANFLRQQGWQPGLPWGFEVQLPAGFDFRNLRQTFAGWARLGVKRSDGHPMPRVGEGTLFLPGGARGPAFLLTDNYNVIKAYNASDAYALGVAHLGDRIYGGRPIQGAWPKDEPLLDKSQREEMQQRLTGLGFYSGEVDGRLGAKTREAVRQFQLRQGLTADGYANLTLLQELRRTR
jgi:membrane-bound lytic murein transglycosylase B